MDTKSHPSQELLATDSCWEKKYSLRVLPLMNEKKKKGRGHNWVGKEGGGSLGEVG